MTPKFLFVSLLILVIVNVVHGSIAINWGQGQDSSLKQTCATKLYTHVNIAYLSKLGKGNTPLVYLPKRCNPSNGGCISLGDEIKYCQSVGVKVFLSIGSDGSSYTLSSSTEAKDLATYLWNNFLGGYSTSRPFGNAVLDGIDFYMQKSVTQHYDLLARYLSSYSTKARKVYLIATPPCNFPDKYTNLALSTGLFDYIVPRYYNNFACEYSDKNANNFFKAWTYWTSLKASKVFLGLPAHPKAVTSGFIPVDVLKSKVLPVVKKSPKYGGAVVWNRYWDQIGNYCPPLKNYV